MNETVILIVNILDRGTTVRRIPKRLRRNLKSSFYSIVSGIRMDSEIMAIIGYNII